MRALLYVNVLIALKRLDRLAIRLLRRIAGPFSARCAEIALANAETSRSD